MACSKDFYSNEDENDVAGYHFKAVEEEKALECPICMLLLRQTMGTPCSHLFCLVCLQQLLGRRDIRGATFKCPVCNSVVDTNQVFPIVYMDRCVRGSNVYCQQHKEGCEWKGTLAEYFNKHENKCDFKVVTCKYEGCEVSAMRRRMMKDHELHCPFRTVQCNHCTTEVRENSLEKHYHSCEKLPSNCEENGCNVIVPKNEMEDHLTICNFVNVHCPYMQFGCREKVARKNVEKHLEVNTQQHMMFICEKYHDMENSLRTEIEILKAENTNQNVKIENQTTEIEKLKTESTNQNVKIDKQNTNIDNRNAEIEQLKKKINKLETKPKFSPTKNESEKNLKIPCRLVIDIDELLPEGADRWIRKRDIDFEENDYDVWFKKIYDWMVENKIYRYNNVMYVKVKGRKQFGWYSNSMKEQERRKCENYEWHHKDKDGLLLVSEGDWLNIHTGTFDVFNHESSSCMILHPYQDQMMMRMKLQEQNFIENIKGYTNHNIWSVDDVPTDFYVNDLIIVCLINI